MKKLWKINKLEKDAKSDHVPLTSSVGLYYSVVYIRGIEVLFDPSYQI